MALKLEEGARCHVPELDDLVPVIFDKVIPRLLRPLESDGRTVKPSFVYGDLWFANSGVDLTTGQSLIFDACCFYAHNECKSQFPTLPEARVSHIDLRRIRPVAACLQPIWGRVHRGIQ